MLRTRVITGAVYFAVIVAFFALRLVDARLFGILIYAFSLIGTYEMVHALSGPHINAQDTAEPPMPMSKSQKFVVYAYAILFTPSFYVADFIHERAGFRCLLTLSFLFALVLFCLLVVDHKNTDIKGTGAALMCGFYPTAILSTTILTNALPPHGAPALGLLLIFVISPVTDTFAFFVGSLCKGKKLCPTISPNKTVSGAIGGIVFGSLASILLYWLYTLATGYVYEGVFSGWAGTPWIVFAVIGLICSFMTEFGDLVESVIKRKCGIKDMGRLLPGHGGVLDRIDGTLFASTFIYLAFILAVL